MANRKHALAGGIGALGLSMTVGCMGGERYRNAVDPCAFERYSHQARQSEMSAFSAQVGNGHILDQTIFNYCFDAEGDKLNATGMDKLDQLVRRRPQPDSRIFLATARDFGYADDPVKYAEKRRDLDSRRAVAIKKYMEAQTASRPMGFEVLVHDPMDPSISAISANIAVQTQLRNYTSGSGTTGGGITVGGNTGTGTGQQTGTSGAGAQSNGGQGAAGGQGTNQGGAPR